MRRVSENRCGYAGYTCVGLPRLKNTYRGVAAECGRSFSENSEWVVANNYHKLPTKFAGFVSQVPEIYDMAKDVSLSYPEKTCITCVNIFDGGTFFDLYVTYGSDRIFYWPNGPSYTGAVTELVTFDSGYTQEPRQLDPDDPESKTCETYLKFSSDSILLDDPLLEPLLETDFQPADIAVIPSADLSLDGAMISLVQLTKWRLAVEKILEDLINKIGLLADARDALMMLDIDSTCNNFRITASNGQFMKYELGGNRRKYNVSGGSAMINGTGVMANGLSGLTAPFTVYLNVTFSNPEPEYGQYQNVTASLSTAKSGTISVQIGGVTESETLMGHNVARIQQTECDVVMDVIRTGKSGVLYRLGGGASPYKVYQTAECDSDN